MKIDITGRQIEVTPALRDFTLEKLRKLEKLLDGPLEVHVVLAVEKHRHLAEIQVKSRTAVLSGTEETGDLYASIGEVADKLERQALKHKEKVTEKKRREGTRVSEAVAALTPRGDENGGAGAREELPAQILESRRYRLKPLAAEDAVMELEATGEDLLVYRDARTYRVNVVYRRKDGHFGLVDPEF
jgi:putative sigma-54 modulation protein